MTVELINNGVVVDKDGALIAVDIEFVAFKGFGSAEDSARAESAAFEGSG